MTGLQAELDAARVSAAHHRRQARTLARLVDDLTAAAKHKQGRRRCRCGVCRTLRALDRG